MRKFYLKCIDYDCYLEDLYLIFLVLLKRLHVHTFVIWNFHSVLNETSRNVYVLDFKYCGFSCLCFNEDMLLPKYYYSEQIKEDKMCRMCGTYGEECMQCLVGKLEERDRLGDLGMDDRVILNFISNRLRGHGLEWSGSGEG